MNAIDLKLMVECRAGRAREVRRLIALGANVNAQHDALSMSPIEIAVRSRHLRVLRVLLSAGADTSQNERFVRLLREAMKAGFVKAAKLLTEYRINANAGRGVAVAMPGWRAAAEAQVQRLWRPRPSPAGIYSR